MWLEAIYSLRMHKEKNELILFGVVASMECLALLWRCRVGSLSITFFGLLGAPQKLVSTWDLEERRF